MYNSTDDELLKIDDCIDTWSTRMTSASDFQRLHNGLSTNLTKISTNVSDLEKLVQKLGTPEDSEPLRERYHRLQNETKFLMQQTNGALQELNNTRVLTEADQRRKKTLTDNLPKQYLATLTRFQEAQRIGARREKESLDRARAISFRQHGMSDSPFADDFVSTPTYDQLQRQAVLPIEQEVDMRSLRERDEQLRQLETNIIEVNELFKDVAKLVHEQGAVIDTIQNHVETTVQHTQQATQHVAQAVVTQSSARRLNFAMIEPNSNNNSDQSILDIDTVRILPMSHKYDPSSVHAGLLIYSVDGQTDFILNDAMFRMKTGDILIHQIHHVFSGPNAIDVYRDLIRTLFGTHRINLIGLVFTFSGDGQFTNCMRWGPIPSQHTTPIHPTEQKLLEILLVTFYMNHTWLSMPIASHTDMETLSQLGKKQYLSKLAEIEQLFHKRRQQREKHHYLQLSNLLKLAHHSSDNFRLFEWTPNRQQLFDDTIRRLLDVFYNLILQIFEEGEFDSDQYIYFNDSTQQLFSNLAHNYTPATPAQNYYWPQQQYL
ncbi:unnamed protein product [Rotaria sordida]|uniref:t-SNARE coiled-coil homology domain-containing protein n=1 Tax=Rotaria sordida TaxID=392033 RepID=A0A814N241_9BILA|nr:unnamed protein product [Rotaria sordida]